MANLQHLEVFAGENRTPTLYARDPSNVAVSLSGKTITWNVGRSPRNRDSSWPIFSKTGTIVSAPAGTFTVAITPDDTQYMAGDYEHMALTTDGSGNVAVVTTGRFRVRPTISEGT
jgi:uncharacterized protein (DUF2345 family)